MPRLAASLMYTRGAVPEIGAAWTKALEIAESLDDAEYQLRSLCGLWAFRISSGQHRVALTLAQRFYSAGGEAVRPERSPDRRANDRGVAVSSGRSAHRAAPSRTRARPLCHSCPEVASRSLSESIRGSTARASLRGSCGCRDLPDQAIRTAESSVEEARATNHANSLGYALVVAACPIALWVGDLAAAEHYVEMLLDHSTRHGLARWRAFGRCYQGMLVIQRGDLATGLRLLRAALTNQARPGPSPRFFTFLMAEAWVGPGGSPTGSP